jgi:enterochelin esterase-like enzyme
LIHGSNNDDSQWDEIGADEAADRLIIAAEISPMIILMPRDRQWTDPIEDPFGNALIGDILPWVEANYRTIPDREFRAIGGLSRGASWAVHLGLSHWELFGAIGGHSLPVFVTDPQRIERWLNEIPEQELPRIYLDIGENDYLRQYAAWFEALLTARGIPHEWYLFPGRHNETYWQTHVEQYLRWYAAGW